MPQHPGPFPLYTQPLIGSDLHIWSAALSGSTEELAHFHSLLAADEKARAERFYFERDRDRYIVGRGILRTLLAGYLDMQASEIRFVYGPQRKPAVDLPRGNKTLHFNLAHCNEWAAYVFGWERPVGIDLEHIRPVSDVDDLVQRFFSPRESTLIRSLSGEKKWDTFFQIWTCKEAILKAHGSGLTTPLDQFEISVGADGSVTTTLLTEDLSQLADWKLQLFELIPGYKSAISVQGNIDKVIFRSFAS
jgi:4'-phosphopantetheinyl transferase